MLPMKRKSLFEEIFGDSKFNLDFENFFDLMEKNKTYQKDQNGNLILEIEVPGFNKDNIKVEISDGILTVQGKTDTRDILKRFTIGNISEVKATIKDGILSLTLISPKKESTKIEIQ